MSDDGPTSLESVKATLERITYKPGYRLIAAEDKREGDRIYLQVECERPDIFTGEMGIGRGGKAYLSPSMVLAEIVRVAFGLLLSYEEHECREWFKYWDRSIFGPHISIGALWEAADQLEFRPAVKR